METVRRQPILIVEPDTQFREELYNFLLSAGYEKLEETGSFADALDKIDHSLYAVVLAAAGEPLDAGLQFAADLAQLCPQTKLILMIEPEDHPAWDQIALPQAGVQILIKTGFAQNLLYLLETPSPP